MGFPVTSEEIKYFFIAFSFHIVVGLVISEEIDSEKSPKNVQFCSVRIPEPYYITKPVWLKAHSTMRLWFVIKYDILDKYFKP